MLDMDLIDSLDDDTRTQVRAALATLTASGIFELQQARILATLAAGSESQETEEVVGKVLKYRADRSRLLSLHQLGDNIIKDREQ